MTPRSLLLIVFAGYFLASWALNPVAAILPTIATDLGVDVAHAAWLMNSYFLLLVTWVLVAGRVGDALGHGVVFRGGCVVFAAGSLLAVGPVDYVGLLVARGLQGLGSAMLYGTSLALVASAYQGRRLGFAVGMLAVAAGVSGLVGVSLTTMLIQFTSWHWTFVVPAVVGALVAVVARGLPSVHRTRLSDIDWLGGLLLVGALSLLLLGFSHLHEGPETFEAGAPYHLSVHLGAVVVMAMFVWRQLRVDHPLLQLRLLRIPRLSMGVVANGIAHSSMLATSLLLPFLLECGRGYSPTQTAELVVTMQVCLIAGSIGGGVLLARYGASGLGVGSMAGIAGGLFALGQTGAELPFAALFPLVAVLGTAQGTFTAVNNTAVMSSLGADQRGFASGLVEMTRHLGHALGTSVSSSVLMTSLAAASAPAAGYRDGFATAATTMAAVAAVGIVVVLYPTLRSRVKALSPGIEPQTSSY